MRRGGLVSPLPPHNLHLTSFEEKVKAIVTSV